MQHQLSVKTLALEQCFNNRPLRVTSRMAARFRLESFSDVSFRFDVLNETTSAFIVKCSYKQLSVCVFND